MPALFTILALFMFSFAVQPLAAGTPRHAAGGVPTLDAAAGCKDVSTMSLNRTNYERCMSEEQAARSQLQGVWASFSAEKREQCLHLVTPPALPSYVTLQECLNISRDAERLSKTAPGISAGSEIITSEPK